MKKSVVLFTAILISLSVLVPYSAIKKERRQKEIQEGKYKYSQKLNNISQKLFGEINQSFEYVEVLEMILQTHPNDIEMIEKYSQIILDKHDLIYNIALAPQGIVKHIYPIEGNEEAVGHNLMTDPQRSSFIKKAIDERKSIVQGPVESLQGRVLIFSRKPVFVVEEGVEKFWGLLAVSLDFEEIIGHVSANMFDEDYFFSIRAFDSDGYNDFIWGDQACFNSDSITTLLNIANQKWELAIYPKDGWRGLNNKPFKLDKLDKIFIGIGMIVFISMLWHLNRYLDNHRRAQTDLMTGALNKNTFEEKVIKELGGRPNRKLSLIVIDINKFKLINDKYGHFVGDYAIIELSKRLQKVLRSDDLLARWGGDEFFIYLNNIKNTADVDHIVSRIHTEVAKPFDANNETINIEVALGYAIYPDDGTNFDRLYNKADQRMYANKA